MFYKLIVNAAFMAFGYYIGKEIGRSEHIRKELEEARESVEKVDQTETTKNTTVESNS